MNWDDLKYFLAVSREGSIRAAAKHLGVNHATVSRRINSFEANLNQRLFERTPQGYVKTRAGEEIYLEAAHLEERLSSVQRKAEGKDTAMSGLIRVTAADVILQFLIMDMLVDFAKAYPNIDLEVIDSARSFNLTNREADVAIRVCKTPPEHLIGRKLADVHRACYVSRERAKTEFDQTWVEQQNWIGWSDKMRRPMGKIAKDYPRFESRHSIMNAGLQAHACRQGLGISVLPCFIGDGDAELVRVPPGITEHKFDLWVLSHPDLRQNTRIRTFVRFMNEALEQKRGLIEGKQARP